MMENVHYSVINPDMEFYQPNLHHRGWKESQTASTANNNNNSVEVLDSSFSINVSTGESELFLDDLIELADSSSSTISTPSPVVPVLKQPQHIERTLVRSAPPPQIYHSRLHEALTQPRLPTQPVKCQRCGNELTSRCLMQTCADDTKCRTCGKDLTAKCILAVCTVQPKTDQESTPRKRVHHYSSPSN